MNWMQLFRTGTHTDASGKKRVWSKQDLETIASKYNEGKHEAPLVVGHPKDNDPAYGWIKALRVAGEVLEGLPRQVNAAFGELVNQGAYKKRSISLYPDMTLRHVGFLGAMPPAVKGLKDVSFSDQHGAGEALVFDFSDPEDNTNNNDNSKGEDNMKRYLLLANGKVFDQEKGKLVEDGDAEYEAWIKDGNEPEGDEDDKEPAGDHSEPGPEPKALVWKKTGQKGQSSSGPASDHSGPTAREIELTRRLDFVEAKARKDKADSIVERLVSNGQLTGDQSRGLAEYMASTEAEGTVLEFADGSKKPGANFLSEFLSKLPKQGHLDPLGPGAVAEFAEDDKTANSIAEASGFGPQKS